MRTTVRLDEQLLSEVKKTAAESGRTLTSIIEDSLREYLARKQVKGKKRPTRLPSFGSGGLKPGVDLDNTAALLALLDAEDEAVRR
jgi:hypothetical protein